MDYIKNVTSTSASAARDIGLRDFMVKVFSYMCYALVITGVVSFFATQSGLVSVFFTSTGGLSGLGWLFSLAPLLFVFMFQYKINTVSASAARMMLWIYASLMGLSLAPIFLVYTGESVARVFFITASVFGAMAIYGHTTKRDLTGFGSFLMMGLIGVLIAYVVNLFMQSPAITFITSIVSVLVFTGFTAYDVQKITNIYYRMPSSEQKDKAMVVGALTLYLDFINLFLSLLRLMGDRK